MIRLIRAELVKLSTTRLFLWLGLLIVALSGFVTTITVLSTDKLSLATLNQQRSLVQFAAVGAIIALIVGIVRPPANTHTGRSPTPSSCRRCAPESWPRS